MLGGAKRGDYYSLPRGGGLLEKYVSSSSSGEENEEEQVEMDVDDGMAYLNEEDEKDQIDTIVTYPAAEPWLVYSNDKTSFYFDFKGKKDVKTVPPNLMKALSSMTDLGSRDLTAIAFQPAMPMPVHASPLVSLFENAFLLSAKESKKDVIYSYKPRYISFTYSCYQLHQLARMCVNGVIPFHPTFNVDMLRGAEQTMRNRIKTIDNMQNEALDELYDDQNGINAAGFASALVAHSYRYIHVLEEFIWTCLVAPYGIPLVAVLTPEYDQPTLGGCSPQIQEQVIKDMITFFRHKVDSRAKQEAETFKKGETLVDAPPLVPFNLEDIPRRVRDATCEAYMGYMPLNTLFEYVCFLDCDGKMKR
jgi:hypothetical protein